MAKFTLSPAAQAALDKGGRQDTDDADWYERRAVELMTEAINQKRKQS